MNDFVHKTVLLNEAVDALNCRKGKIYIDATAGGGGHSFAIAEKIFPEGRLIIFDTDPDAIKACTARLEEYKEITTIIKSNYSEIPDVLKELNIEKITGGILFDLGVSYHQLTSEERGFSFMHDSALDMRMNPDLPVSAYDIVNSWSEEQLYKIFKEFGEERFSRKIAKKLVQIRKTQKINTTKELADILLKNIPRSGQKIHPATRIFQALRIAVNQELELLEKTLNKIVHLLDVNARIVVISFHSLEDRLVKNNFRRYSSKCICPLGKMICECEPPVLKIISKKPLVPSREELRENPSSRSAKMRIAEKII
ncbi:MAG TPA: 16S rRNA (cytosine(1402)-N(4))-methyltransferase RsmH [Candidatus Gastranaerophilales bacterium]|nr:16S rRNA (cytosine(1402)-N(4))-methyltransferase RsmH [Candidatus Gastranaerophilales bacterium]